VAVRQPDDRLVVNPHTRIVHRADCHRVGFMQLHDPLPIDQWPLDARYQLRACDTCQPTGWNGGVLARP
jgi:hypothetical protein